LQDTKIDLAAVGCQEVAHPWSRAQVCGVLAHTVVSVAVSLSE